eukprot:692488-Pyramimonas_sp.AAC.1
MGSPCARLSSARGSPLRPDEIQDPTAVATIRILRAAHHHHVKWVLENPIDSKIFKWTAFKRLIEAQGAQEAIVD